MFKITSLFSLAIFLSVIAFFTCKSLPTNPLEDTKNLQIGVFLKGNKVVASQNDSVFVGVVVNIPNLVKSLRAVQGDDSKEVFLSLNNPSSTNPDTVYFKTGYKIIGTKTITVKAVLSDNTLKDFPYEIEVIAGNASVWKQDLLSLEVQENSSISRALDGLLKSPDLNGITYSSDKGIINGNVWRDSIMWGAAEKDTVNVLANYNGTVSAMKLVLTVIPKDLEGPEITRIYPAESDVKVSAKNVTCSFTITDNLSGVGGVVFKKGSTILTDTLHSGDNYQCVVKDLVAGEKTILTIEAYDKSMKKTTASLNVSLTYDPEMVDNVLPKIIMKSPSTTTVVVSTSETSIQVICTDESGIDTVTARKGTTQLKVERADTLYSVTVSGLTSGKTDTIVFEATDKSSAKNKAPLSVYVTLDPTSLDKNGPKIALKSPATSNTKVSSSSLTFSVICTDESKVASVTYKTGTLSGNMTAESDNVFTATIVGLVSGINEITITAKDKSPNVNSTDSVFKVIYEKTIIEPTTPVIMLKKSQNDSTVYVNSTTATIEISCTDQSGIDTVVCKKGTTSIPVVRGADGTFTATVSDLVPGSNKFVFTATDRESTPQSVSKTITVIYELNTPSISKHPVSQTVCSGSQGIFSITATGTGTLSYQWRTGAAAPFSNIGSNSPICTLTTAATSILSCVVSTQEGTSATSSLCTLTVNVPAGSPTGKATPDTVLLGDNKTVTLSVTAGTPGTGGTWVWYASDKTTKVTTNPFTPTTSATYYVRSENAACGVGPWSSAVQVTVNQPAGTPTGIATPTSLCLGDNQTVTLSIVSGDPGTGGSWVWYAENKETKITTNPFTPTNAGIWTYYVRSEGGAGGTGAWSAGIQITVNQPAGVPTGTATPSSVCLGSNQQVTLSATGTTGTGGSWVWYEDNKTTKVTTNPFTPSATKSYYVRSEGSACGNGPWSSSAVTVTVNQSASAPTSVSATPASICGSGTATLKVAGGSLGTGGATWKWYTDAACSTPAGSGEQITPTVSSTTTYYVRAEGGSCNASTATASATINVVTAPTAPLSITPSVTSVCGSGSVKLTVNGGSLGTGGATWKWYRNATCSGTSFATGNEVTETITSTTTYGVRAEGGSCNVSTNPAIITISLNVAAGTPIGSANPATVCSGGVVTLLASGNAGTGGSWVWYESDKSTRVNTSTVSPKKTTTYYVRSENGVCGEGTFSNGVVVTVNAQSTNPTSLNYPGTSLCPGTPFTLEITGGSLGTNAQWVWYTNPSFTNPIAKSTSSTLTVSPEQTTTYYVRAEGDCNTTTSLSQKIDVRELSVTGPVETIDGNYNEYVVEVSSNFGEITYMWQMLHNDGSYEDLDYQNRVIQLPGTTKKLKISNYMGSYQIRCRVTDECGTTVYSKLITTYYPEVSAE